MAKMWAGRTDGVTDKIADDFNSSISFDSRMYKQDIEGSMAHAAMLAKQGIISADEASSLVEGLGGILSDLQSGALKIDLSCVEERSFALFCNALNNAFNFIFNQINLCLYKRTDKLFGRLFKRTHTDEQCIHRFGKQHDLRRLQERR